MDDGTRPDSLAKAVRFLAIMVGCFTLVLLVQVVLYAVSIYRSAAFYRGMSAPSRAENSHTTHSSKSIPAPADGRPFETLPPEKKIARAAAILLTRRRTEDGRMKSIVTEILKQEPGAAPPHAVGDEIMELSRYDAGDSSTYGDGEIIFYRDPSFDSWESTTYRNGRIPALADMPFDTFRALATGKPSPTPAASRPSPVASASASASVKGERIELERATNGEGITRTFSISRMEALSIPEWKPETGEPPLAATKAAVLGTNAARAGSPGHPSYVARGFQIHLVGCCDPLIGDRWYYVIDCIPAAGGDFAMRRSVPVVVLMDGRVVPGVIGDRS